jgi:hypothetical protein
MVGQKRRRQGGGGGGEGGEGGHGGQLEEDQQQQQQQQHGSVRLAPALLDPAVGRNLDYRDVYTAERVVDEDGPPMTYHIKWQVGYPYLGLTLRLAKTLKPKP